MQNMLMGRYIPGDSIIHRMDPRSKLLVMIAFVVIIFLAHDWLGYLLLVLYTLAGVLLSKISVSYFLKGLRPMIGLILFTVIFQMLFTNGQHVIFSLWFIKISTESLTADLDVNDALKEGIFWADAKLNGIITSVHQYMGSIFENTVYWNAQMQNESVKDTLKQFKK